MLKQLKAQVVPLLCVVVSFGCLAKLWLDQMKHKIKVQTRLETDSTDRQTPNSRQWCADDSCRTANVSEGNWKGLHKVFLFVLPFKCLIQFLLPSSLLSLSISLFAKVKRNRRLQRRSAKRKCVTSRRAQEVQRECEGGVANMTVCKLYAVIFLIVFLDFINRQHTLTHTPVGTQFQKHAAVCGQELFVVSLPALATTWCLTALTPTPTHFTSACTPSPICPFPYPAPHLCFCLLFKPPVCAAIKIV